jgi:hypothetical protein
MFEITDVVLNKLDCRMLKVANFLIGEKQSVA